MTDTTAVLPYSPEELMTITAARVLHDGDVVFVGVGLPNLACNLARRLQAPRLEMVYEAGVFGARPGRLPLSIGDPCLVSGALAVCSLPDVFLFYLQRGLIDVGFLGAAQIDRCGNINTTSVGPYGRPRVRLPGSGGACEIALLARKVFVVVRQSTRSFVERVDFVTSPGFPGGKRPPGAKGLGPQLVVSDLATYGFDEQTGEMRILTLHPGVTYDEVRDTTGWPIPPPATLAVTPRPTAAEIRILREEVDPGGHYLKSRD
jgi:glutaconate CoA-transferase subunit B